MAFWACMSLGGILSAGVLTLTDCTISGNFAGAPLGGGGVLNDNGTMTITGCTINNNGESGSKGGGGVLNDLARGFLNIWRVGIE
jgi:fibronectin-binding autotransporter adhesin